MFLRCITYTTKTTIINNISKNVQKNLSVRTMPVRIHGDDLQLYDQQFAFIVHAFQKLSQRTGARNPAFLKNVGVFGPGIVQASAELKSQWMAERLKHQNQPQSRDTRRAALWRNPPGFQLAEFQFCSGTMIDTIWL